MAKTVMQIPDMMNKELTEIKQILAQNKEQLLRDYKVKEIGIFGSYVRSE